MQRCCARSSMTRGGSRSGEIALGHHVLAGDLGVHDIIEQISQRQRSGSPVTAFLRWLKRYRAPIQVVFGVVAVAFLVWAVLSNWSEMVEVIGSMSPVWVLVSIALAYLGTFANALSWRSVVHSFGARIGVFAAARITFIAQIGKYIPGGVWPMVAGSQLGGQAGIASSTMVVSMTVQLAVSLVAAAVISVGTLLLVPSLAVTYWWVIVLVISCGIVLLLPPRDAANPCLRLSNFPQTGPRAGYSWSAPWKCDRLGCGLVGIVRPASLFPVLRPWPPERLDRHPRDLGVCLVVGGGLPRGLRARGRRCARGNSRSAVCRFDRGSRRTRRGRRKPDDFHPRRRDAVRELGALLAILESQQVSGASSERNVVTFLLLEFKGVFMENAIDPRKVRHDANGE
ncbi:flippase-like domain-containing protein [Humibacter ginsenosidimutans]|uniref:Flippase-like domain-containing protein n=1 Tax=Humibacter ginsenosidimutans TaxID=2599293 RepID=A0A5B8M7M9_9MICO|nr:flippase-like domain-containing protein [Humibacter ginsenosidimutans]